MIKIITTNIMLVCLIVQACNHKPTTPKSPGIIDGKRIFDTLKEPLLQIIPDSMKAWIPAWEKMGRTDQQYRSLEDPTLQSRHISEQKKLDSANFIILDSFFNKYGYPSVPQVGLKGMRAINLVMQHGDRSRHLQYYDYMKEAFEKGKINGQVFSLFEDRLNIYTGRKQYYGTQVSGYGNAITLYPVVSFDSLDFFRKQVGLGSISEYAKIFKKDFNKDIYESALKEISARNHIGDSTPFHFLPKHLLK